MEPKIEEGESLILVDFEEAIEEITIGAFQSQASKMAEEANREEQQRKEQQSVYEQVPAHYREFIDVFQKKEFDALPKRRPWDHAIELKSTLR